MKGREIQMDIAKYVYQASIVVPNREKYFSNITK